jgi:hypothetical protein
MRFLRNWQEWLFIVVACASPEIVLATVQPRTVMGILACTMLAFIFGIVLWFAILITVTNVLERLSKKK